MPMDMGDWSLLGTAPGFVKRYSRGCKRIVKRHQSKRNRQQAKRQLVDEDQPPTNPSGDRPHYYDSWTRAKSS